MAAVEVATGKHVRSGIVDHHTFRDTPQIVTVGIHHRELMLKVADFAAFGLSRCTDQRDQAAFSECDRIQETFHVSDKAPLRFAG